MNNEIEVHQPEWSFYFQGRTECCHIDLFFEERGISLEKHNLEDTLTWVHEFTERALRNLSFELQVSRIIVHGSWKHYVSFAHILASLSTHVGMLDEDNNTSNMTNDDYWFHMITGIPPSFRYCEKE